MLTSLALDKNDRDCNIAIFTSASIFLLWLGGITQYRLGAGGIHTKRNIMLLPHGRTYSSHALNYFLKFFVHIFQGKLQRLESFPNCGRVRNPQNVECIWDCDWIANPLYGQALDTTISLIPLVPLNIIIPDGLTYNLIKYPQDPTCLQDCSLIRERLSG